ncbi:unnamed protein product [Brachionus calyciflorus]|uniref:Peptidase metallopeptidase domain-containing protein n=1 Tax=Brachionus calyciflorus TaxID=104777 RepID=A0A814AWV0_9BILA|nr:unnamed protein product [Brachionus calyciflorus]
MIFKLSLILLYFNFALSRADISPNDALSYLEKYGYTSESQPKLRNGPSSLSDQKSVLKDTLSRFQLIHGLKVTGVLDAATEKKMKSPRCSLPDFRGDGKVAFFKASTKWSKKDLTYRVLKENQELRSQTRSIIAEAFKYWSQVSGLKFTEVSRNTKADLSIDFGSRNHGDNYPFDGPGGVLAHAFFPEHGEIHFDEDETFTDKKKDGTDLKIIAIHEFGHALGLEHSLVQGAVMNPYYQGYDENFKLGKDDIDGIQFLYGKPTIIQAPTAKTTTKTTTKPTTKSATRPTTTKTTLKPISTTKMTTKAQTNNKFNDYLPCHIQKQAIFLGPDFSTVYASLEDNYGLFKFDQKERIWKRDRMDNVYPRLPEDARGGVIDDKGIIWFFYDFKVYAYNRRQMLPGYPKIVTDFLYPRHPYAAAFKNKKFYVYKNWLSYEFDVEKLKVTNIHRSGTIFRGIPLHIDAAFRYNDIYYFFSDSNYYKFDEKTGKVIDGYPKETAKDWILCKK